ncbi:hypothetical protein EPI10_030884 [Gossypium australe]|uniref:Uncharacterized protein n=1 Tax=Gossypium australe TaxID=47621 RepID=A0A5B6X297_9ROSI|nr:hypothetical protein EPI10_030884 [Gossypium australe]
MGICGAPYSRDRERRKVEWKSLGKCWNNVAWRISVFQVLGLHGNEEIYRRQILGNELIEVL